ncbi:hypothetical protein T08_10063 [Trichinella sp. T8]|nr:hypothetical protein T08_10063 [Trichinella sp. T8]
MLLKLPQHPGQEFESVRTKIGHSDCAQFIELKIGVREGRETFFQLSLISIQFKDKRNVRAILIASPVISGSDFSTRLLLSYVKLKQSYAQIDQFDCSILVTESTFPLTS